jgi:hypothetical protein
LRTGSIVHHALLRMRVLLIILLMLLTASLLGAQSYLGFDKNEYPGDDLLPALRKTFSYTGFWLNHPPGMSSNPWTGKRSLLKTRGFGFLILFNGRLYKDLSGRDAASIGQRDAALAIAAAKKEGFPRGAVIFLDQEEGGRLLPEQRSYLFAWVDAISQSTYRSGVYCSGLRVSSGAVSISTAEDIQKHAGDRKISLGIANDQCPPSPGCSVSRNLSPSGSGYSAARVWQYGQSPRRAEFTNQCSSTYADDNNCYAPGLSHDKRAFVDLNVSSTPDPSFGR